MDTKLKLELVPDRHNEMMLCFKAVKGYGFLFGGKAITPGTTIMVYRGRFHSVARID